MYQSIYYDKNINTIHIWDDEKGHQKYLYQPYAYRKTKQKTEYQHIYGFNVEKVTEKIKRSDFESDVLPQNRYLIDNYENSLPSKNIKRLYFDIEVEKTKDGYSNSIDTENKINAISFYLDTLDKYFAFILVDESKSKIIQNNKTIVFYTKEEDLIKSFINIFSKYSPHVITHWNGDSYDIPYLCNRTIKVLSQDELNKLSPINIVKPRRGTNDSWTIAGVSSLDYMSLYKNFTYNVLSSYSLDFVCRKEIKKGKIEYDGDLGILYNTDLNKFIDYSLTDVELIVELDQNLDYIELARSVCHKGFVPYESVYMSSHWLDGAVLSYLKSRNLVAPNKKQKIKYELLKDVSRGLTKLELKSNIHKNTPPNGILKIFKSKTSFEVVEYTHYSDNIFYLKEPLKFDVKLDYVLNIALVGAFVMEPQVGVYDWVYDMDLTSLYPSIIRTLNISPEMKYGRIRNFNFDEFYSDFDKEYQFKNRHGRFETITKFKLRKLVVDNEFSISANGVLYSQKKQGIIPHILTTWFNERVEQKNLKKKYGKEGNKELKKYYHQRQLTTKIMLNSFYGVLGLSTFRFYDIDNAEATTTTGQHIIKWSAKKANEKYNELLSNGLYNEKYVIYIDTDSIFLSSKLLINKFHPEVQLTYDITYDNDLKKLGNKDAKLINQWYSRLLIQLKELNFLGEDSSIYYDVAVPYMGNDDIQLPLFTFQTYLKDCYSIETASREIIAVYYTKKYAKVVQHYINESYNELAFKIYNVKNSHALEIKQEYVAKRALWLAKKRYAHYIIDNEGIPVSELDVKGIDIVRSDFPKLLRASMEDIIVNILNFRYTKSQIDLMMSELKDVMKQSDLSIIGKPTGVRGIKKYAKKSNGVPIHVKSSINYNKLLEVFGDNSTEPIKDESKIMWYYLKSNKYGFDSIAIKGYDDNNEIIEFIKQNIDYNLIFSKFTDKVQQIYNAMNWGEINLNPNIAYFFNY